MMRDTVGSGGSAPARAARPERTMGRAVRKAGVALAALIGVTATGAVLASRSDVSQMASAADAFLRALTDEQRERARFDFSSAERQRWHFIPIEMFERHGVMLKDLDSTQRERAHDLLRAGLSQRGYMTATQVMELEDVLRELEGGGRFARDRDEYLVSVFGTPGDRATWGWRFEGHHISLHFTVVEGTIGVASPAFLGANPAEVRAGPQAGRRVLGQREDAARALLEALDPVQRGTATITSEAPRDIVTGSDLDIERLTPVGLAASGMTAGQRTLLMELIEVYASMMSDEIAERRLALLRDAGTDAITFAWAGGHERGAPHYYRVQGPTFLIEYDNTQNDANHIHSVWRDFDGDFGRDLLREHLERHPH